MIKAMYLCNKQKCGEECNNPIWGECHDTTDPDYARDKFLVDLIDDINTAFEPRFKHTQEADYCLVEKDDFDIKDVLALKTVKRVDDVLDKIRAEIEETKDKIFCTDGERQGLDVALGIIDKYRNEVSNTDAGV